MSIADEVEAALRLLQDALARAEATLADARSRAHPAAGLDALGDQVEVMRLELARLRREFGVQVTKLLR